MGQHNVYAASKDWSLLPPTAFLLLTHLARTTLDYEKDGYPPRRWYRGRAAMCALLGKSRSATAAALQVLIAEGVVVKIEGGYRGSVSVYELNLKVPAKGPENGTLSGVKGSGKQDPFHAQKGPENRTPRSTRRISRGGGHLNDAPAHDDGATAAPLLEPWRCRDHQGIDTPCYACGVAKATLANAQAEAKEIAAAEKKARDLKAMNADAEADRALRAATIPDDGTASRIAREYVRRSLTEETP